MPTNPHTLERQSGPIPVWRRSGSAVAANDAADVYPACRSPESACRGGRGGRLPCPTPQECRYVAQRVQQAAEAASEIGANQADDGARRAINAERVLREIVVIVVITLAIIGAGALVGWVTR